MRRALTAIFGFVLVPSALVVLPVVTSPAPSAHPVAPTIYHLAVSSGFEPGPQQSTKPFRAVGLSWRHDPAITSLTARIRVHDGGQWSEWQQVDSTDTGPDGGADGGSVPQRDGTDPLWVDHADGVQVQVERVQGDLPTDLQLDLIEPGKSAADAVAGTAPSAGSVARADTSEPPIITRAQWGADESIRLNACSGGPESAGPLKVAFIHHTVTTNDYTPDDVPAIIRSIYAYHVQGEGWCDIGYNFLVDKFGRIFEGRYGGVQNAILGAHTGGFNSDSFGVSMIGTYDTVTPPIPMTDAITQLLAWKFAISYLNPLGQEQLTAAPFSGSRYATGTTVTFNTISGHRDADLTACPGNAGYAELPFIRQAVAATMVAGLVDPAASVAPRTVAANGSVRVLAGMLQPGDWQLAVQDASGNTVRTMSGSGSSVDATWDMTSDGGQPVPNGDYTLTVTSTQAGVAALPWSTTVRVGAVFGALDSIAAAVGGQVHVTGWAMHGTDDAPVSVRLTLSGATVTTTPATDPRPDVASTLPGYSANHGFDQTMTASPGTRTVCAYGVNDVLGGADSLLGCRSVVVPGAPPKLTGPAANPVGNLDAVQGGPVEVMVRGWSLDPETSAPINVAVYADNVFKAYLVAAAGRPDVAAAHPNYGPNHGFYQAVGGIAPGNHRVCVYGMNVGNGTTNPTLGCATVTVPTGNPFGHADVVKAVPGGIVTWGWAIDPDTAGAIQVHLYLDGRLVDIMSAADTRTDVASHYPLYGATHGYAAKLTVGAGRHTLCAYALNVGGGSANSGLGCATVSVLAGNPIGSLDTVQPVPGGVVLWGWAIDPDTADADQVTVTVDGAAATSLTANQLRPDVAAAYPDYGAAHGYASQLTVAGGQHTICVEARNLLAGTANTRLGCRTVTVLAGPPFGHLDGATATNGVLTVWGWAIDPDVVAAIPAHVYVDGKLVAITTADGARPDVAKAYPSYGPNHGFYTALPIGAGSHQVCVYAINTAAGVGNPNLGCRTVKS